MTSACKLGCPCPAWSNTLYIENIIFELHPVQPLKAFNWGNVLRRLLIRELERECEKLIARHEDYLRQLHRESQRIRKQTGLAPPKNVLVPSYWNTHRNFNPYKTRSSRRINTLAYGVSAAFLSESYRPKSALTYEVPKDNGSYRTTSVFQIPDAVLSRVVYQALLRKNRHRMSAYAYAYRDDIGSHEAIANVANDFSRRSRTYVAEYDFSAFFDNIRHEYLWKIFDRAGFVATRQERQVLEAFMATGSHDLKTYRETAPLRSTGIPQGTSVSLFLANVACWDLDRALERLGVGFARYADDTLIWSDSYTKIVQAHEALDSFSAACGVLINEEKSDGIHLLSRNPEKSEIRSKSAVTFLGYSLAERSVSISEKHVARIKKKLSKLIYCNLLQVPKQGLFVSPRLSPVDWDYLVCIAQIRRYLYGGLKTLELLNYTRGVTTKLRFRGLMSYYPNVSDARQLRELDGWLLHSLRASLKLREKLIASLGGPAKLPGPEPDWIDKLETLRTVPIGKMMFDYRVPSFSLILKVLKKALEARGTSTFASSRSTYY